MPEQPFENQTRTEPFQIPAAMAALPRHGLVTRPYDLSPREFEHLKQFDPVLAAAGGAILSFAIVYGLPLLARSLLPSDPPAIPVSKMEWWVLGVISTLGALLLLLGFLVPGDRRAVMKKIKNHFKANPDVLLYKDDLS